MIVVSYYTPDYAHFAVDLVSDLERLGIAHDVREVPDLGSWQANTRRKPTFLRKMLNEHGAPVVWIDADARVDAYPQILDEVGEKTDVSFHVFRLAGGRAEPLSGTVWVSSRSFLRAWEYEMREAPDAWDQVAMGRAANGYLVQELPPAYCWIQGIFDKPFYERNNPGAGPPVIRHFQASRQKRGVKA